MLGAVQVLAAGTVSNTVSTTRKTFPGALTAAIVTRVEGVAENTLGGLSSGRTPATIASVSILGLGIIAAPDQVGIATTVTTPVLATGAARSTAGATAPTPRGRGAVDEPYDGDRSGAHRI